jgi:hypothetical protein
MKDKQQEIKDSLSKIGRYSLFPKPIAKSVGQLVKPIYKKHGFAEHRILTEWPQIVGVDLASCGVPQKLVRSRTHGGGTLYILVASARALELQHMQPVIIDKIATYFGHNAVQHIRLTQTSSDMFRKKRKEKSPQKKDVPESVARLIAECADPDLRQALLSLGGAMESITE